MPAASSASAFGFMTLVAGLRLMQSRSWIVAVLRHIGEQIALDLVGAAGRDALGQRLHITFGRLGNPGAALQHGHLALSLGNARANG